MFVYQVFFWIFATIGLGGLCLGLARISGRPLGHRVASLHGIAGLFAIGALFLANLNLAQGALAWWVLMVFTGALVGGLVFFRVLFQQGVPKYAMLAHGSVAALALCLLYQLAF